MFPQLEVLDGFNREGEEVFSNSEDEEDEEGEADMDDDFLTEQLTEEQLAELKKRGITPEQFLNGDDDDFLDEEGEEDIYGDEEYGEEEEDDDQIGAKRLHGGDAKGNGEKRAKGE